VVLVAKPPGPTSHDVVDMVRRALGIRRVGHLGTLDPFAEGLLVMIVGRATRLAPYAKGWTKSYTGTIRLGVTTATDDLTGDVTATSEAWRTLGGADIAAACARFVGAGEQQPPAFSAVKVAGERAYARARRGDPVTLASRSVEITDFVATEVRLPEVQFRATVSAGTYVRSLARDVGTALGCGAHLSALRRTAVGPFRVEDAVAAQAVTPGDVRDPTLLVADLPRRELDATEREAVSHGRPIPAGELGAGSVALMAEGSLLGVGEVVDGAIKPRLVLAGA
jgi:tRNA pseudouridine55 synthase